MSDKNLKNVNDNSASASELSIAESALLYEQEERKKNNRKRLLKFFIMLLFTLLVLILATIAWFAMNKNTDATGMGVTANSSSFELKSEGDDGLYDDFLDSVVSGYADATTTESSAGIKWNLSATSEIHNRYTGAGTPDMEEITRRDSSDYGLTPGDGGTLKFKILPKVEEEMTIDFTLTTTGYTATFDSDNYKTDDDLVEVSDDAIIAFAGTHILFFYVDDNGDKHLIGPDGFSVTVDGTTVTEKEVTIFWVWPATLKELTELSINGLADEEANKEVRRLLFENPADFLKPIGEFDFSEITVAHQDDLEDQEEMIEEVLPLVSGRFYSQYAAMYNDADQAIGDNTNYMLVELEASR